MLKSTKAQCYCVDRGRRNMHAKNQTCVHGRFQDELHFIYKTPQGITATGNVAMFWSLTWKVQMEVGISSTS